MNILFYQTKKLKNRIVTVQYSILELFDTDTQHLANNEFVHRYQHRLRHRLRL